MKNLLLDTHIVLWMFEDNPRLCRQARELLDRAESLSVSSASIWEIAIKAGLGKIRLDIDELFDLLVQTGIQDLPVTRDHAKAVQALPYHHRDPFDRLLIVQAEIERMTLLTQDTVFRQYRSPNVELV